MRVNLRQNASLQFSVLSDDQCEQIALAAFEVLERVGARFYESEALEIFKKAGCAVSDGNVVQFPSGLIKQALNSVPARFTLYTRTGQPAIKVEPNRAHFGPGPTCCNFLDPETGERRLFVKQNAALTARVCDALPNIDYVMSLGSISDVPQDEADIHEFDAMVRETTKPIMSWSFSRESLAQIHRMCAAVKASEEAYAREPFMIFYAEPSSPLKHSAEAVQKLIYCARHRIPIVYTPCPIAGGTAPATLAGVLVQNLAETLGGVVLSQLIQKGAPLVVGGVVSLLDMRTTILSYGAPELALLSAGATEVARSLGLPMFSTAGCTDSKCLDEQTAVEATTSILLAELSGANFIHDVGYAESGMTGSLPLLVMCDEIIGMARHIARGIRVDEETLAVDAIAEAAGTGNYLALDHTARHFRDQFWFPRLMDRRRYGEWAGDGEKTMGDRVRERLRKMLEEHRAPPLSSEVTAQLDRIVGNQGGRK
jgi:trimethylamine--corrinoid protein Co-methyltransferase